MKIRNTVFLFVFLLAFPAHGAELSGDCTDQDGDYGSLIRSFESGGLGSTATNPGSTATGTYQFLYGTLADLGYIDSSRSTQPPPGSGEWNNVVWTGQDGVNSRTQFMNSPEVQSAALDRFTRRNLSAISGSFTEGQKVNGITMTSGGAAAAAHMLGAGGFRRWADSGFSPSGLDADIARDHGWTPEQYNNHLMERVAAGGCFDPDDITAEYGDMEGVPEVFLMPFGENVVRPRMIPGSI